MILKQKADLAASFQRIKDILHSAGEKSVASGTTTETVHQTTEPSESTSQTLPKQMKNSFCQLFLRRHRCASCSSLRNHSQKK